MVCLTRGCCQPLLPPSPGDPSGSIWQASPSGVLAPQGCPRHAAGTERCARTCSTSQTWFRGPGWWHFREILQTRAAHHTFVRGCQNQDFPVAELLSEHCWTGKCSTSHIHQTPTTCRVVSKSGRRGTSCCTRWMHS